MITNIPTSTRTITKVCAQANGVQRALCTQDKNEAQLAGPKKPLKQIDLWKQRRKWRLNQVPHIPTSTKGDKHCFLQACLQSIRKQDTFWPFSKMSQPSCKHPASSVFLHMPAFLTAISGATGAWKTSYGRQGSLPTKVLPFLSTFF